MKEVLFVLFFIINIYYTGKFIASRTNFTTNKFTFFSLGFVFQIAVIELLGWWMVAYRMPTILFAVLTCIVMLIGMLFGIMVNKTQSSAHEICGKKREWNWELILLCLFNIFLCIEIYLFYRADADDSFYVSNVLLFSESNRLNLYDSSFGNTQLGTVPMYDFQIWESYLAVLCKIFSIKASVMCHFVMIFVLLGIAVSAYICLGDVLFHSKQKSYIFTGALLVFYCMGGYAVYSKGSFLLSRIWQGKAVYLHVVLPIAIAVMLKSTEKVENKLWLYLVMVMLAGVALNPTSMYVVGFQILFMILAITVYKKQWKYVLHMLPTLIIVGIFSVLMLLRASKFDGQIEAASAIPDHFVKQVFFNFMGDGWLYVVLYILCCIVILLKGDNKAKILCLGTPILLFLGVWNPLMAPVIAKNLTMVPSYWRVFWLLPIDFSIAYCAVLFYKKKKMAVIGEVILICMVMASGKFMFTENNNFIGAENKERIPSEVLFFGNRIVEDQGKQIVLANDNASTTLRQEFNDIELIFSRYQYVLDLIMYRGKHDEAEERIDLMEFVNGSFVEPIDYEYINLLLNKYAVKWIIIDTTQKESIEFLQENKFKVKNEMNGNVLLEKDMKQNISFLTID